MHKGGENIVTRKNVAERANVSVTVVSRVTNNNGYVADDKRKRVEKVIEELGYSANLIARGLKTNETKQILFYAPELSNPFYVELYQGMEDYAEKHGYTIVVSSHYDDDMIYQRKMDGMILSAISKKQQAEFLKLKVPVVVTNYSGETLEIPSVGIDMMGGARKAVGYLCESNHKRIGFITNISTHQEQRYLGYLQGLKERNIQPDPNWVLFENSRGTAFDQGFNAAHRLLELKLDVTAIFVFNDAMAIGVIAALAERGIRVPEDLSIIGFDDILQAQYTCPPLTTIHIPKYEQGEESARMLIRKIKGKEVRTTILGTDLMVRGSVKSLNKEVE